MRDGSEPPQPGIAASANAPGLLWAYAGSAGVAPVQLSVAEIPGALAERDWVWINVDLIDRRVHGWVGGLCGEQSTRALLAEPDAALSVEPEDGEIHGICADFNMDFLRVSDSIGRFGFSASQRLVVTGWRHPLSSLDAVRNAIRGGTTFACGFDVLAAIVAAFCRSVDARLRAAEVELDKVEDQLLAAHTRDERLALKEVRRLALALHRPVGAMVTLLGDAAAEDPALPPAGAAAIEQMAARLRAVDQTVLQLNDRAKLLQEEMAAELAGEFEPEPQGADGDDRHAPAGYAGRRLLRHEHGWPAVRAVALGVARRHRDRRRRDVRLLPDHGAGGGIAEILAGLAGLAAQVRPTDTRGPSMPEGARRMIAALTLLFVCQLAGEVAVRSLGITFPGPVLGMGLLFAVVAVRGRSAPSLDAVADTLLRNLSLLFVPAAVGVVQQIGLIAANWVAITAALVASTLLTLVVTVYTFRAVAGRIAGPRP